jgi:galactokinase/CTP:molybdopterin cytidylyltransferase MocA
MKVSELKTALARIVSSDDSDPERLSRLCSLFLDRYGDGPASLLRAPARINVLGEHIDYVSYLPTASLTFGSREHDVLMLYRDSGEPRVRSASTAQNYESSSFDILDDRVPEFGQNVTDAWLAFLSHRGTPAPHWQNYIRGAVTFARGKFAERVTTGFDFALDSTVPAGGGASSSSALVVLGGAAVREVNKIRFSRAELARDSALAEWYIGTRGGSMDHTTICLAQRAHAVVIDYRTGQTRQVYLPDEPFQWLTFFSKPADKGREVMIEYNERAAVSRLLIPAITGSLDTLDKADDLLTSLPETMSINTVRSDYPQAFTELERSFPALLNDTPRWPLKVRSRALHHLEEVRRVTLATEILDSVQTESTPESRLEAMTRLGELIDESHASLRDLYNVSTSEVEELVGIVRRHPGVLGARLMGGGFGGNILALTTSEHAELLIQHVQQHYYDPQHREGVREGSIMISTPGDGLAKLELLDVLPAPVSQDIWPVIVAAGKGTRAFASGLEVAKPVALIDREPAILHVLNNVRRGLGQTRPPVIVVSPETEAAVKQALRNEDVLFVTQPSALGTGDAVLHAHELMHEFTGLTLVVWSTQPVIQPATFERTAKLANMHQDFDMIVPTTFRKHPYAPIRRNELGAVQSASETHLESAEREDYGETNIGMFLLKNQSMFEVLLDLRSRYWNEANHNYDRSRGELGFPNEVINSLAKRESGVFACAIADWREEQGIKQLSDVSTCEQFISELR